MGRTSRVGRPLQHAHRITGLHLLAGGEVAAHRLVGRDHTISVLNRQHGSARHHAAETHGAIGHSPYRPRTAEVHSAMPRPVGVRWGIEAPYDVPCAIEWPAPPRRGRGSRGASRRTGHTRPSAELGPCGGQCRTERVPVLLGEGPSRRQCVRRHYQRREERAGSSAHHSGGIPRFSTGLAAGGSRGRSRRPRGRGRWGRGEREAATSGHVARLP